MTGSVVVANSSMPALVISNITAPELDATVKRLLVCPGLPVIVSPLLAKFQLKLLMAVKEPSVFLNCTSPVELAAWPPQVRHEPLA